MLQTLWDNSNSKKRPDEEPRVGQKSVVPCVTPVWNRQSEQQVVLRR